MLLNEKTEYVKSLADKLLAQSPFDIKKIAVENSYFIDSEEVPVLLVVCDEANDYEWIAQAEMKLTSIIFPSVVKCVTKERYDNAYSKGRSQLVWEK